MLSGTRSKTPTSTAEFGPGQRVPDTVSRTSCPAGASRGDTKISGDVAASTVNRRGWYSSPVVALASNLQMARISYWPAAMNGGTRKLAVHAPLASGVAVKTVPAAAVSNGVPSMRLPVPGGPVRAPTTDDGVPPRQFEPETVTSVNWDPSVGETGVARQPG